MDAPLSHRRSLGLILVRIFVVTVLAMVGATIGIVIAAAIVG